MSIDSPDFCVEIHKTSINQQFYYFTFHLVKELSGVKTSQLRSWLYSFLLLSNPNHQPLDWT